MQNATEMAAMDPVQYITDGGLGGSGVLDIARELKVRLKAWAYAWKVSGDQQWVDRTWRELQVASGNSSQSFGADDGTRWNPTHFLYVFRPSQWHRLLLRIFFLTRPTFDYFPQ